MGYTVIATEWVLGKKKSLFFSCSSKQKCMKLKKKKMILKEIAQSFIS